MEKKIYVLTLSKTFMKGHPRAGELTHFKEKFLSGEKIHTIRAGEHWKLVVHRVNNGTAILSVREWSGKPYKSKQVEIAKLTKLGWQEFVVDEFGVIKAVDSNTTNRTDIETLTKNDGLSENDFLRWFNYPNPFNGGIIHFTNFRY